MFNDIKLFKKGDRLMNGSYAEEDKEQLSSRNILLFVIGKFISLFGASIYSFAVGLYILKITGSGTSFALALVFASVPRIIFGPIAGTIADRFNRKTIIISTEVLSGILMFFMIAYAYFFGLPIGLLYTSEALLAIFSTFFSVTASSSIPSMAGDKSIQKAQSLNQSASSLAGILGPISAGILYGFLSIEEIFLLTGTTFMIAAIIELFIIFNLYAKKIVDQGKEKFLKSLTEGFSYLKENDFLFSLLKVSLWLNFFFAGINVAIPYILNHTLEFSSQTYGIAASMVSVGALIASLIISSRPEMKNKLRKIRMGLTGLALMVILIGIPPMLGISSEIINVSYYIIVLGLIGSIIMVVNIPIHVLIQRTTPSQYLGRIFGFVETIASAISPLGMILFGILLDYIPAYFIPFISGFSLLLISLLAMTNAKEPKEASEMAS